MKAPGFVTTQTISAHVPLSTAAALYEAALKRGVSRSQIVREAIENGLAEQESSAATGR